MVVILVRYCTNIFHYVSNADQSRGTREEQRDGASSSPASQSGLPSHSSERETHLSPPWEVQLSQPPLPGQGRS